MCHETGAYFRENLLNCYGMEGMRNIYVYVHGTSRYGHLLRAGQCWDQIQVEARFSAPVRTGTDAHPASCKMGTGSLLWG